MTIIPVKARQFIPGLIDSAVARALFDFSVAGGEQQYATHPPLRPLPTPSTRPIDPLLPAVWMAPEQVVAGEAPGNDANSGTSIGSPILTWNRAQQILQPGWQLIMRGARTHQEFMDGFGVHWLWYHNGRAVWNLAGLLGSEILIRSHFGEVAFVHVGVKGPHLDPDTFWEETPAADGGVEGEYRSIGDFSITDDAMGGNFAETMVPVVRYPKSLNHLRAQSEYRPVDDGPFYGGPGLTFNWGGSNRFHARFSHTTLPGRDVYGQYEGETDPRLMALIVPNRKGDDSRIRITKPYIKFQDLVFCGSSEGLELQQGPTVTEGCWLYGVQAKTLTLEGGAVLHRLLNTKIYGYGGTPWQSRWWDKNVAPNTNALRVERDVAVEFDRSELCFSQDYLEGSSSVGAYHGNITIKRCLVEIANDDFLGISGRAANQARIDITLSWVRQTGIFIAIFNGEEAAIEPADTGIFLRRSVIDLRPWRYRSPPTPDNPEGSGQDMGNLMGEHGSNSPRPHMRAYHCVVLTTQGSKDSRSFYFGEWGEKYAGTTREIYNSIKLQITRKCAVQPKAEAGTFLSGGNCLWSVDVLTDGTPREGDFIADPKLVDFTPEYDRVTSALDVQLQATSPCRSNGVLIPASWPDELRDYEANVESPDVGAAPFGLTHPVTGEPVKMEEIYGPLSVFGG